MRRVFCLFLLLLFITPVFAEGLPSVEDAVLADDGSVEIKVSERPDNDAAILGAAALVKVER